LGHKRRITREHHAQSQPQDPHADHTQRKAHSAFPPGAARIKSASLKDQDGSSDKTKKRARDADHACRDTRIDG
jgi:hypothetical protein